MSEHADPYEGLATWTPGAQLAYVVVDTPRGSRNKYKFDPALGMFKLSRILPVGASFPFDFGSIPRTAADDGDPLDVLVIAEEATFVGCVLEVKLIGVIEAEQTVEGKTERNDRLLGVPVTSVNPAAITELAQLKTATLDEIELFFESYNRAHGREFVALHRRGPAAAVRLVEQAATRYARAQKS